MVSMSVHAPLPQMIIRICWNPIEGYRNLPVYTAAKVTVIFIKSMKKLIMHDTIQSINQSINQSIRCESL